MNKLYYYKFCISLRDTMFEPEIENEIEPEIDIEFACSTHDRALETRYNNRSKRSNELSTIAKEKRATRRIKSRTRILERHAYREDKNDRCEQTTELCLCPYIVANWNKLRSGISTLPNDLRKNNICTQCLSE